MATIKTGRYGDGYSPYVQLDISVASSDAVSITYSWAFYYIADYKPSTDGKGRAWSVTIDGTSVASGSFDINQKTGKYTLKTGTTKVNRTTSSRTMSYSCSFNFGITWAGTRMNTITASGTDTISPKTSYTVSYNANGGTGAPGAQTKWYGTNLALSATKPTRTGYTFQGWATSASGSVVYNASSTYTNNASVTLYAVWKIITYTVTYNANGGTGAPGNQTKSYGTALTLSNVTPTKDKYNFKGWGTAASATTVSYNPGASYTTNAALSLYAIWEIAYIKPRIDNFVAYRSDENGEPADEGTCLKVSFTWATDEDVTDVKVEYVGTDGILYEYGTTPEGKSGTFEAIFSDNMVSGISTEMSYAVKVSVYDESGDSYRVSSISTAECIIDTIKNGVAIGKVAEKERTFEVAYASKFTGGIEIDGQVYDIADFAIACGKDGIWRWKKFANGDSECWGKWTGKLTNYTNNISTSGLCGYNTSIALPAGLFISADEMVPAYSACVGNAFALTGTITSGTIKPASLTVYVAAGTSGQKDCILYVQIKGRWK